MVARAVGAAAVIVVAGGHAALAAGSGGAQTGQVVAGPAGAAGALSLPFTPETLVLFAVALFFAGLAVDRRFGRDRRRR